MVDQAAEFPLTAMVWLERPERIDRGGIPMKRFLGVILMCAMLLFTAAMAEHSSPMLVSCEGINTFEGFRAMSFLIDGKLELDVPSPVINGIPIGTEAVPKQIMNSHWFSLASKEDCERYCLTEGL